MADNVATAPLPLARPRLAHSPCAHCLVRARSFCAALKDHEFEHLAGIVSSRSFAARRLVVQEGDPADILINVVAGTLKIFRSLPDGRTQVIGFLGPGDFLGMPPGNEYAVSAESITTVEVCNFPRRSFERLLKEQPALERRLFDMSLNELVSAQNHLLLLGRKTARERVASFLCQLAARNDGITHIDLPMTRTEIADYLGLTMETVSRTLASFKKQGLLAIETSDRLRLTRLEELTAIAAGNGRPERV